MLEASIPNHASEASRKVSPVERPLERPAAPMNPTDAGSKALLVLYRVLRGDLPFSACGTLADFDQFVLSQDSWAKVTRDDKPTRLGSMSEDSCVAMCDERSMDVCAGVSWDSETQSCFVFTTVPIHRLLQQPERDAAGLRNPHKLRIKTMPSSTKFSDNELCRL
ncbi:unnamed protein product [Prorocentrum cordatum]|uniref:Apple domain-containing protein n=1 Tax=Prorocentrum cordatum TaxID=2364126 RepID=A0ABN9URM8_9DINO|nr:unnamed protein product [Polarella glacialis]